MSAAAKVVIDPRVGGRAEVEITFTEDGGRTRVDLRHRHLERYGHQADAMYASFNSPGGWAGILDSCAEVTT